MVRSIYCDQRLKSSSANANSDKSRLAFSSSLFSTAFLILQIFLNSHSFASDKPFIVTIGFGPPVADYCRSILNEAFGRLNRTVVVKQVPAERSIQMANDGLVDADCMRISTIGSLYPNLVQVPEKIFDVRFVAFSNKVEKLEGGWHGLKPYTVGALNGWKLIEIKVNEVGPKSFVRVNSSESLFKMLELMRIDVAALNLMDGLTKIRQLGFNDRIHAIQPPLASVPLYFSLHQSNAHLIEPLGQAFKTMKQDGSWQQLEDEAFGPLLNELFYSDDE